MKICGIYKITSPIKKIYIGKSIDIFHRWKLYNNLRCKSQTHLYNSLKKYGANKHKFEIICQCDKSELNNLEKYYIALFQCFNNKYGLNLKSGGEGGSICSDETKKKQSDAQKRIGNKPPIIWGDAKGKFKKGQKAWNKGKKMSHEQYEACKNTMFKKGSHLSEEIKQKMSESQKGRKHTEATKIKMSESAKNRCKQNNEIFDLILN